jgi:hypothetical protein
LFNRASGTIQKKIVDSVRFSFSFPPSFFSPNFCPFSPPSQKKNNSSFFLLFILIFFLLFLLFFYTLDNHPPPPKKKKKPFLSFLYMKQHHDPTDDDFSWELNPQLLFQGSEPPPPQPEQRSTTSETTPPVAAAAATSSSASSEVMVVAPAPFVAAVSTSLSVADIREIRRAISAPSILKTNPTEEDDVFSVESIPESELYRCTAEYAQLYFGKVPRDPRMPPPIRVSTRRTVQQQQQQQQPQQKQPPSPNAASSNHPHHQTGPSDPSHNLVQWGVSLSHDKVLYVAHPTAATAHPSMMTTHFTALPQQQQRNVPGAAPMGLFVPPVSSAAAPPSSSAGPAQPPLFLGTSSSSLSSATTATTTTTTSSVPLRKEPAPAGPAYGQQPPPQPQQQQQQLQAARRREADLRGEAVLADYLATKRSPEWQDIASVQGHIAYLCKDQDGSRLIQRLLDNPNSDTVVFEEVQTDSLYDMVQDVFGNYVIQKLVDVASKPIIHSMMLELQPHLLELSLHTYGCRVIQKILHRSRVSDHLKWIADALTHSVVRCIMDQNGNHVIQKMIDAHPSWCQTIVNEIIVKLDEVACHPYGCRVVQRLFEQFTYLSDVPVASMNDIPVTVVAAGAEKSQQAAGRGGGRGGGARGRGAMSASNGSSSVPLPLTTIPENLRRLVDLLPIMGKVLYRTDEYVFNQYGNYAVQHAMLNAPPDLRSAFVQRLTPMLPKLAGSKFASNVAEKALTIATTAERGLAIAVVCEGPLPPIVSMMQDAFANYVVQRLLDSGTQEQRNALAAAVAPWAATVSSSTFGRHLLSRMEKMASSAMAAAAGGGGGAGGVGSGGGGRGRGGGGSQPPYPNNNNNNNGDGLPSSSSILPLPPSQMGGSGPMSSNSNSSGGGGRNSSHTHHHHHHHRGNQQQQQQQYGHQLSHHHHHHYAAAPSPQGGPSTASATSSLLPQPSSSSSTAAPPAMTYYHQPYGHPQQQPPPPPPHAQQQQQQPMIYTPYPAPYAAPPPHHHPHHHQQQQQQWVAPHQHHHHHQQQQQPQQQQQSYAPYPSHMGVHPQQQQQPQLAAYQPFPPNYQ